MKRRRLILIAVLLVVVAGIGYGILGRREPRYQGKSLSDWFVQFYTPRRYGDETDENDDARRSEAAGALRAIGTNAVPFLLKECFSNEQDSSIRSNILTSLSHLPAPFHFSPFVPAEDIRGAAAEALLEIRPPAELILSSATNALARTNLLDRQIGIFLLGTIGHGGQAAIPWLSQALRSPDAREVAVGLLSIEHLGQTAKGALPEMINVLTNGTFAAWVRYPAVSALASLGSNAVPAIPVLKQLFPAQTNHFLRTNIAVALCRIDRNESDALVAVTEEMTRTNTPQTRKQAADFLGSVGPNAKNAAPLLIAMLEDDNIDVACAAAAALKKVGVEKSAVLEPLTKKLTDDDEQVRFHAAKKIVQFDPGNADALAVFIDLIRKGSKLSMAAMQELGALGRSARAAIPTLREASRSNDRYVRGAALSALQSIESAPVK
jgi:HEAT repeat protein